MSANELSSAARAGLADLVAPLREQLNQLDVAIIQSMAELEELRKTRSAVKKTLVLLDPSPKSSQRQQGSGQFTSWSISPETLSTIEAWLREHAEEINANGGFTGTSLVRDHGFELVSKSSVGKALIVLHERGVVRLDHRGTGGSKHFKVVV